VQLQSSSSITIDVAWEEVPIIGRNGLVILYEVLFEPADSPNDTFDRLESLTTNATELFVTLTGLRPFVNYAVSVRAYTSVGPGPFSEIILKRTEEDGKQIILLYSNQNLSCFICLKVLLLM
jgi:hypothetical protein